MKQLFQRAQCSTLNLSTSRRCALHEYYRKHWKILQEESNHSWWLKLRSSGDGGVGRLARNVICSSQCVSLLPDIECINSCFVCMRSKFFLLILSASQYIFSLNIAVSFAVIPYLFLYFLYMCVYCVFKLGDTHIVSIEIRNLLFYPVQWSSFASEINVIAKSNSSHNFAQRDSLANMVTFWVDGSFIEFSERSTLID